MATNHAVATLIFLRHSVKPALDLNPPCFHLVWLL
jgi:hypothetical protein